MLFNKMFYKNLPIIENLTTKMLLIIKMF